MSQFPKKQEGYASLKLEFFVTNFHNALCENIIFLCVQMNMHSILQACWIEIENSTLFFMIVFLFLFFFFVEWKLWWMCTKMNMKHDNTVIDRLLRLVKSGKQMLCEIAKMYVSIVNYSSCRDIFRTFRWLYNIKHSQLSIWVCHFPNTHTQTHFIHGMGWLECCSCVAPSIFQLVIFIAPTTVCAVCILYTVAA